MSYSYSIERERIFTAAGEEMFLKVRDESRRLLDRAGAFTLEKAIEVCVGDTWMMLACVDRLEEIGEVRCLLKYPECSTLDQVYVKAKR